MADALPAHKSPSRSPWRDLALLALVSLPILFTGLGEGPPKKRAEMRCLAILETMTETGDFLVPRLEGRPHLTKPPLFHWMSCAVAEVRGRADLACGHLVSALHALAAVLGIYVAGRLLMSAAAGWWSALLLLTTVKFIHYGHMATFDGPLTAWVVLAVTGYLLITRGGRPRWGGALLLVSVIAGFLIKGFLAWLAPLMVIVFDLARRRALIAALRRSWPFILVALAGSLSWHLYLWFARPEFRDVFEAVITNNFGRNETDVYMAFHPQPAHYYLKKTPGLLLPWILFLIPVLGRFRGVLRGFRERPEPLLLFWWLGGMLILSLVPAKNDHYLLPFLPAWTLLAGGWIHEVLGRPAPKRRLLRWLLGLTFLGLTLAAPALPVYLWVNAAESMTLSAITGGAMLLAAVAGFTLLRKGLVRDRAALGLLVVFTMAYCPLYASRWEPRTMEIRRVEDSPLIEIRDQRIDRLRAWGIEVEK